ncbi:hypothetical protein LEP1GSC071_2609 [Leptospira santarosai str. JET]|uniref:Uncharacterized protein n=1 Tax=Leptospira santarosai serovar Shermani str. LT 821 TaxID=758847 RepID=K8XXM6_9LEPT|nr:hypothetical protein LEP1GSC071_2609 [Leptospira santarosai str. JET]EKT86268.1 hypothetical protein LSS_12984 [Leptospira santarosai serovar Shermani str. LT 821]
MQDLHSHKTRRLCIKTRNNAEVLGRDNKGKSVKNFRNRPRAFDRKNTKTGTGLNCRCLRRLPGIYG